MTTPSPDLFIDGYIPSVYSPALNTVNSNDVPYWRSIPRAMTDATYDILKVNFRQAVLITDISFDMLKINSSYSVYYTNRNGLLLPVVLSDNSFFQGTVQTGDDFIVYGGQTDLTLDSSWLSVKKTLYPIVAKSIEIRMQRTPDSRLMTDSSYRLGIRKFTMRRTIATEQNKYLAITDTVDSVGNYVQKTFLDWEPEKGADGDTTTFWKSAPQPSPNAVVSYYLDVRNTNGDSTAVDKIWIDPAYTGPQINLYTSNDDTESTATLSTVAIAPLVQLNTGWFQTVGIDLTSASADLEYSGSRLGMMAGENFWIALAFNFAFDSSHTVGANLTLFAWDGISIVYNDSAKTVTFKAASGLTLTTGALSFSTGDRIIVIFQLRSLTDPSPGADAYVYHGAALASHVTAAGNIGNTTFSNNIKFAYSLGYLTQAIIKRGTPGPNDFSQFVASPVTYVNPDPVVYNGDQIVSTTLDNAVLGGNFLASPLVFAGASFHRFAAKTWSPVWANYTCQKGFLVLPQQMNVKYIKLEFTNLTPQPYPIVDPDIQVQYREFPITFSQDTIFQQNTYTATSLDSRMGAETQIDPNSVADKYGLSYGPLDTTVVKDVQISVGDAVLTQIPHTYDYPVTNVTTVEPASSTQLLNATTPNSMTVVQAQSVPVIQGDTLIGIAAKYGIADWHQILDLNSDLLAANTQRAVNAGYPRQTPGWWIFPGQQLRISTAQTIEWTNTTTVTQNTTQSTVNNKFTITSVHKYAIKTVKRDAAIAYFAGLREVSAWVENLVIASDSTDFTKSQFQISDASVYSLNNVAIQNSNSVTNLIKNPNFDLGIQGYIDANLLNSSLYDALTSYAISTDFAYSGTTSVKLTYGTSTGKNQGLFTRLSNLTANAYVGYTWQTYTVASGVWTAHSAVVQANASGQVDLPMATSSAPTGGTVAYLDAVGAYIVPAANSPVPNFFDGSFARSQWLGLPGESASISSLPTTTTGAYTSVITTDAFGRSTPAATAYTTSFEAPNGVTGWTTSNCTFVASTAHFHTGMQAGLLTVSSNANAYVQSAGQSVYPLESYTASCWVFTADASPASIQMNILWYDINNSLISTSSGTASAPAISTWGQRTLTAVAPSNAMFAKVTPTLAGPPANAATMYIDDVSFMPLLGDVTQITNLVTNPSFEAGTAGWASGGTSVDTVTSIAQDATQHYVGSQSMKIVWKTYATPQGATYAASGLVNGATYLARARVWNQVANTTECFLQAGGVNGASSTTLLRGQWQVISVRWTQTGTTTQLGVVSTATTNLDVTWVDAVEIFQIPTLYSQAPNYFDGNSYGDSWTGTANASTSTTPTKGLVLSPVFNSWSLFRKITATLRAKPLDTLISGITGATALGVGGSALATWEDPVATWADSVATWGAPSALATVNFNSDYVFNGVHSIWVHRSSGGIGGVYSQPITPVVGAHVRASITVFLPSNLNITNVVKIVDQATKATIYLQETITAPRGGWQTYVTNFMISDGTQICIDIESNGSVASDLFIADMTLQQTTITMFASNDSWNTKLDLDNLVWKTTNTEATFLNASNKIQVRFEMLRVGDWISGYSVTPYYLS